MSGISKHISIDPSIGLTSIPDVGDIPVNCPRIHKEVPSRFCKDLCMCSIALLIDRTLKVFCCDGDLSEDI